MCLNGIINIVLVVENKLARNLRLPATVGLDVVGSSLLSGPNKRTQGTTIPVMTKNMMRPMTIHSVIFPILLRQLQ